MADWVRVCATDEVPLGRMKKFTVREENILIAHIAEGFYATGAVCTHMGGDLSKGRLRGNIVRCPLHWSQFDVTTGKVHKNVYRVVKLITRREAHDLKSYPIKVEDGAVWIAGAETGR